MSARNLARERRCSSVLPLLTPAARVPPSASSRRNVFPRSSLYDRSLTPFSDFFSESDTGPGTPDLRSEESDSSAGSVLERATAEATRVLADEWERIENTLYEEEGEHVTRPQLLQECQQWRQLFPHLRVVGKKMYLPERRPLCYELMEEEILAIHYSDYENFSESEERLSESSCSDTTPSNSPRLPTHIPTEPRLNREKSAFARQYLNDSGLNDSFYSMLQITPLYPRSPPPGSSVGKRHYSSILKSEISSSKWMRNCTPESPQARFLNRSSAKSFISLDTRNCASIALSATERKLLQNESGVYAIRQRENARLEPLYGGDLSRKSSMSNNLIANGKVSLPPLHIQQEKNKCKVAHSARRNNSKKCRRPADHKSITLISEAKNC